jgi:flagellar motor switch protein FliM
MLPDGLLTGELGEQVRSGLRRVFDEDVMLWLDYVHSVPAAALKKVMGDPTFLGVIAPSPHGARGLVELDLVLAHSIIDLLLGAPGESAVARPLTECEQGVLSYVLLETFKAFSPGQPEPGRHPLRLERIVPSLEEGLQLFAGEATVAIIELKVLIGAAAGYLRLHLPASAVAAAVPPDSSALLRKRRLKRIQANLARLRSVKVKARLEIGHSELTARDIAALRTGDVMIVDELTARVDKGEKGTAKLRIGAGRTGRIEVAVEVADGTYKATVEKVVLGEEALRSAEEQAAAAALTGLLKIPPAAKQKPPPPVAGLGDDEDTGQDTAITDLSERMRLERKKNGWEENTNVGNKPEDDVQADAAELLNDVPLQISVRAGAGAHHRRRAGLAPRRQDPRAGQGARRAGGPLRERQGRGPRRARRGGGAAGRAHRGDGAVVGSPDPGEAALDLARQGFFDRGRCDPSAQDLRVLAPVHRGLSVDLAPDPPAPR